MKQLSLSVWLRDCPQEPTATHRQLSICQVAAEHSQPPRRVGHFRQADRAARAVALGKQRRLLSSQHLAQRGQRAVAQGRGYGGRSAGKLDEGCGRGRGAAAEGLTGAQRAGQPGRLCHACSTALTHLCQLLAGRDVLACSCHRRGRLVQCWDPVGQRIHLAQVRAQRRRRACRQPAHQCQQAGGGGGVQRAARAVLRFDALGQRGQHGGQQHAQWRHASGATLAQHVIHCTRQHGTALLLQLPAGVRGGRAHGVGRRGGIRRAPSAWHSSTEPIHRHRT